MAGKKSGKVAPKAAEAKTETKQAAKQDTKDQAFQYTSFRIQNKNLRKDKEGNWRLNVNVPETVSPTGWMNVDLPVGKLADDNNKSLWFKKAHVNKDESVSEKVSDFYIANEIKELNCVSAGKEGAGKKITISPADLRSAVIEQDTANKAAQATAGRETPSVESQAEESMQAGE